MKLGDIMSKPVFTIAPHEAADTAWKRMRENHVKHLVVMRGDDAVGVISMHDVSGPQGGGHRRMGRCVADLMSKDVVTALPTTTLKRAALLMRDRAVGCLPVAQRGRIVGIVTIGDLLSHVA